MGWSGVHGLQFQRRIFLKLSEPVLMKFNVYHHWVGGLTALGFGADCIKIVVSMATDSSHRLKMGKQQTATIDLV